MNTQIDFEKDSNVLKALGHPTRLRMIVGLINHNECYVNDMVDDLKIPQATVSQHLAILKSRGIIVPRKEGVKTCYRVVDSNVLEIVKILAK